MTMQSKQCTNVFLSGSYMQSEIKKIEVVTYNTEWPEIFEKEAAKIKLALGENCLAIEHIGSTSVPGLCAKNKIDIIAEVKDPKATIKNLESIGYEYRGDWSIPGKYGYTKRGNNNFNLHVFKEKNPEIDLNLLFRDYLRQNPSVRDEYAELKFKLLQNDSSFKKQGKFYTGYTLGKDDFIRKVLKQAGFNKLRIRQCAHHYEWDTVKYFRQKYFFKEIADPYEWTFDHPDHMHFVLYEGTDIIGYAHIQLWPEARAALRIIVIDEAKRGAGFGAKFLQLMEDWLKDKDYIIIHTDSSPAAFNFYKHNKYTEMPFNDPDDYERSTKDISMGKILRALKQIHGQ